MPLYNLCNRCQTKVEYPSRICDTCKAEKEEEQKQRSKEKNKKYNKARHEREKEMNSYRLFYNTREWRLKREEILKRDGYECQLCKALCKLTPADAVHHILNLKSHYDKRLDNDNLCSLCHDCHNNIVHGLGLNSKEKIDKYIKQKINSDKFLKALLDYRD